MREPAQRFSGASCNLPRLPNSSFSFASGFQLPPAVQCVPPSCTHSTLLRLVPCDSVPGPTGPALRPTPALGDWWLPSLGHHDRVLPQPLSLTTTVPILLMSAGIKYTDLHSLPAYNTSSTSRLKSLYSDVSRQKHSNPAAYRSTVHWWREVLQTVVLKHWLPQSSDTLVLHALPTLADSFRYEGTGKPLCLATVIVSSVRVPASGRDH